MITAGIERNRFCRAKPGSVVYSGGWCGICNYRPGFHPSLVTPNFYCADISQLPALYKVHCVFKVLLTALPLAALHYFIITLLGIYHCPAFANGITNGFFNIYIFSG